MDTDSYLLSQAINAIRRSLLNDAFFEVHLYSTLNYKIENTRTFEVRKGLFLRYNPEPDIWQVADRHTKFFWIGSMFRNEERLTKLHSYEFTVVDVYQQGDRSLVKKSFLALLRVLERDLLLPALSKKFQELDYGSDMHAASDGWILLDKYLREESFYDVLRSDGRTEKFELFYKKGETLIEIAACGLLGDNANPEQFIKNQSVVNTAALKKGLVGFGIGIERLLYVYKNLT